MEAPAFAFVVHALSPLHRWALGVRAADPRLVLGGRGLDPEQVRSVCHIGLKGVCEGVVVAIPLVPEDLLSDQQRALARLQRAVEVAGPVRAVGLGSLCAVVAGRGEALAETVSMPVTTGAAATAWAVWQNVRVVHAARGGPVAVVGAKGAVGRAVVELLLEDGIEVRADAGVPGASACASAEEAVAGCSVVVGAGPTGPGLQAGALVPGAVLVDVAIPGTLDGRRPDVLVLAGEALSLPSGWATGAWGALYHLLAGYGPSQVFACLVEPLALAHEGRDRPYALGRRVQVDDVRAFGEVAQRLGFAPRLARGWRALPRESLRLG